MDLCYPALFYVLNDISFHLTYTLLGSGPEGASDPWYHTGKIRVYISLFLHFYIPQLASEPSLRPQRLRALSQALRALSQAVRALSQALEPSLRPSEPSLRPQSPLSGPQSPLSCH